MQFADPQATAIAWLILRHLYDGDVIEWPVADDHPHQPVFAGLEAQGYVARWDRVWPLHDRYRLTERGIAAIEQVYRPAGAQEFFEGIRQRNLSPADRRAFLQSQRLDPFLWPLLHDPSLHWSTYATTGSSFQSFFWEDQRPPRPMRAQRRKAAIKAANMGRIGGPRVVHHHHYHRPNDPNQYLVDLDRQAQEPEGIAPERPDYDVS